jgi:hypothetical protein
MKKLALNQLERLEAGRFLGIGKKYEVESVGGEPCMIRESCSFTILWVHAWECDDKYTPCAF